MNLNLILTGLSSVIWTGCSAILPSGGANYEQASTYDVNKYPVNKTVCNPMGGSAPADPLGMLSDDGAMMYLSNEVTGDNYSVVVNDDGLHSTQMDGGPIVSMPLWRPIHMSTPHESLCGANGNSLFFDPDHGSKPLQAYMDLLSRG